MRSTRHLPAFLLLATFALAAPPGGGGPTFSAPRTITNEFFPFVVGAVKSYRGTDHGAHTAVVDLYRPDVRAFALGGGSVDAHLLDEVDFADGILSEISHNYFAQSDDGAVHYFGEIVDIYDETGAVVAHDGSWLVGGPTLPSDPVVTATATTSAVFMPANPQMGDQFKPEDLAPIVNETVTVLATDKKVKVEAGKYAGVLHVLETSALPDSTPEKKWYARGVGVIKAQSKGEKLELIASTLVPPTGP
ncbi:MAG TPA: hypothetical protein VKE69_09095 [Planctomycetota bacterium]|nr:hypothetical protein [Planctomycetota bacterium]